MSAPMGYSHEGDVVTLRMSFEDYEMLLITIGISLACGRRDDSMRAAFFRFVDRLNTGNPHWTPYLPAPPQRPGDEHARRKADRGADREPDQRRVAET
jgi:hypothetical protein